MGFLVLFLWLHVASTAHAASFHNGANGEEEAKKSDVNEPAKESSDKSTAPATTSPKPTTEEQLIQLNDKVRKLEEMVERQQRIIEALQPKVVAATATETATANGATLTTAQPDAATSTTAVTQAADETAKKLESLYKAFGHFNITGDLRFRYDGQFDQGFDAPTELPDRNRLRMRARLGIEGQFHNNFDYGIRMSTGGFTNPTGANATVTDFFNRS